MIKTFNIIYKELYNAKLLILETPVPIPSVNEIEITILEPDPSNAKPEPVMVAQPVSIISLIPIIKSKKLPNPPIFNGN